MGVNSDSALVNEVIHVRSEFDHIGIDPIRHILAKQEVTDYL
jgi:hypothetical protein